MTYIVVMDEDITFLATIVGTALVFVLRSFFITLAVLALMAMARLIDLSFSLWGLVCAMELVVGAALGLLVYRNRRRRVNESSL